MSCKLWKLIFEFLKKYFNAQIFICILKTNIWILNWYFNYDFLFKFNFFLLNLKFYIPILEILLLKYINWYLNSEKNYSNLNLLHISILKKFKWEFSEWKYQVSNSNKTFWIQTISCRIFILFFEFNWKFSELIYQFSHSNNDFQNQNINF